MSANQTAGHKIEQLQKLLIPEMNNLIAGLNSWIIQDGNYGEFERGASYELALEFDGSGLSSSEERTMQYKIKRTSVYDVVAKVIFAAPEVWVLDFGVKVFAKPNRRALRQPVDGSKEKYG